MQKQEGDKRIVAESKADNGRTWPFVSTFSSIVNSPIAAKSPGYSKHPVEQIGQVQGNLPHHNHDAASSSQGWQKDALLDVST